MIRLTSRLLGLALALSLVVPSPLCAGDDNACARLFAALAGPGAEPPSKKRIADFTEKEIEKICTERPCLKHFPWPRGEFLVDEGSKKAVTADRIGEISASVRKICTEWVKDKDAL